MARRHGEQLRALSLTVVMVLSVLAVVLSVPAVPFGSVEVVAGAEDSEPIDSCTQINESGAYHLTADIEPENATEWEIFDSCIIINSSDVTLDGRGNTIDGFNVSPDGEDVVNTRGILVRNQTAITRVETDPGVWLKNVTVRNVTTEYWSRSIYVKGANNSLVTGVEFRETTDGSVVVEDGHENEVHNILATHNYSGIAFMNRVTDSTLSGATIERSSGSGIAIRALDSSGVEITENTVDDRNNTEPGGGDFGSPASIQVENSPDSIVTNNTVLDVDMRGILLATGPPQAGPENSNVVVAHNEITGTADVGIDASESDNAVIHNNTLNETDGIRVSDSAGVSVRDNRVLKVGSGARGVELLEATQTSVVENEIRGGFRGIHVNDADPARLADNHLNSGAYSIDIEGSGSVDYDGFQIRNTTITSGDVRIQEYHNVSISDASIEDGRIRVGSNIGDHRNISIADVEITDNHEAAALRVEGAQDIGIRNVSAKDGLDHGLRLVDVSDVTVEGVTVTGHADSEENSNVRLFSLSEADNASISGLNITDNPVDGEEASSFIPGGVTALDVRHTRDSVIENVVVKNNTHGISAAIRMRGDSANVTLADGQVTTTESGAIEVMDTTTGVTASNLSIGVGSPTNTTLSFAANGVVVSAATSPPDNTLSTAIDRYFDASNLTSNAFLDISLHYESSDVTSVDESTLALWHHDGTSWTELPGSAVDTGAGIISANVTEFSTFGGFGHETAEPDPANVAVTVGSTNSPVTEGDTLTVDATIENTGDVAGTQTVTLSVDGTERDSRSVSLGAGSSTTITLSWATVDGDAGEYTAMVASDNDSATDSVSVVSASTPTPTVTATPTPTPSPTPIPNATPTPSSTPTPIPNATPTPSSTVTSTTSPTPVDTRTETPGFGALTALVALTALAAALIAIRR
jgi:hypothetical protein